MKKILICANSLNIGGIETSLINLLKELSNEKCDITLLLQKKEGILLENVPKNVNIEEYCLSNNKNILLRKLSNRFKLINYIRKNKKKFDASVCYATYDYPSSIITRYTSNNPIIWIHSNYYFVYKQNINEFNNFFKKRKINKFKQIVFVSNESKKDFLNIYSFLADKLIVINNIIDWEKIVNNSNEEIVEKSNKPLILFVGRLEEESKGLLLLFDVAKELKDYEFWIIGDGQDKERYLKYIKDKEITNIKLLGKKSNPYPYIKVSDLLVLPSIYEGFPVVALEGLVLNKKMVTTIDVSANDFKLSDYTFLVKRDKNDIIYGIKNTLNSPVKVFDFKKYNKKNIELTKKLLLGDDHEI